MKLNVANSNSVYSTYTYSKYVFDWESRPNYGFQRKKKKKKERSSLVLTHLDRQTHTHTHTSWCIAQFATSTTLYTPSVLSPGPFWHQHRNQKASHISNANCPSGQKWSTSVEYHNEFQSEEQLGKNTGMSCIAQSALEKQRVSTCI